MQILRIGSFLIALWTASEASTEMVARRTLGLGSIASTTPGMASASIPSKDRKGIFQSRQTWGRKEETVSPSFMALSEPTNVFNHMFPSFHAQIRGPLCLASLSLQLRGSLSIFKHLTFGFVTEL